MATTRRPGHIPPVPIGNNDPGWIVYDPPSDDPRLLHDQRNITVLPDGQRMTFHCCRISQYGQFYEAPQCKVANDNTQTRPYEGRDPNVIATKYCSMCHRRPEHRKLFRCSRCQLLFYCSRPCQREDWNMHKESCKKIHQLRGSLELHGDVDVMARSVLANEILRVALDQDSVPMWEACLQEKLRLLKDRWRRRSTIMDLPVRGIELTVPHILLYLNRDDDCYTFIRYHFMHGQEAYYQGGTTTTQNHDGGGKTEDKNRWIYGPTKPNCRYDDILEVIAQCDEPGYLASAFFVSLCTIKMRIVAHYRAREESMKVFSKTLACNNYLEPVMFLIQEYVVGDDAEKERVAQQDKQVDRLLEITHQHNPYIFENMLRVGAGEPLERPKSHVLPLGQDDGYGMVKGTEGEAYFAVQDCERPFFRVPGAAERLTAFLETHRE